MVVGTTRQPWNTAVPPCSTNVSQTTSTDHHFFLLFDPEHFQRLRDNRKGLFGSFAALGWLRICPADRAQYELPFLVPGFTFAPFCP
tara:strand:- start:669 stop:929 length:261 start_codon:yes stop_codon:yes gene_type:complete